jgi:catechol 2,3-dioxygenase-like lactoylglutathione lyase family enzyme
MIPLAMTHLNLPAREPERLAVWYTEHLGFRRNGRFLWSEGTLLVFVPGEPVSTAVHFGFRVPKPDDVHAWAERLRAAGVEIGAVEVSSYTTVFGRDPEGNRFEIFCDDDPFG